MTHHVSSGVHQHSTHEELVGHSEPPVPQSPDRTLDAIIVPASRSADNLDHAVGLAVAAQCRLVVLCSREAHTHDVSQRLAAQSFTSSVVIDLPPTIVIPGLSSPPRTYRRSVASPNLVPPVTPISAPNATSAWP